ncbi:uncharacterized protein LOC124405921 [Diprion similis]|uniref:uncharacterized protein LOC124405921 n=1 Tax=Diprion similis TaxID=362088 RepID=UPI001EF98C41|nr:uncharacterized protein LOC124405921 [Diprion similis]
MTNDLGNLYQKNNRRPRRHTVTCCSASESCRVVLFLMLNNIETCNTVVNSSFSEVFIPSVQRMSSCFDSRTFCRTSDDDEASRGNYNILCRDDCNTAWIYRCMQNRYLPTCSNRGQLTHVDMEKAHRRRPFQRVNAIKITSLSRTKAAYGKTPDRSVYETELYFALPEVIGNNDPSPSEYLSLRSQHRLLPDCDLKDIYWTTIWKKVFSHRSRRRGIRT